MITSRQRVELSLNHKEPDRIPVDLGASAVTGINVSSLYRLRQALKLDEPGTPLKVIEPYQMLGEIQPDMMDALGIDVVGLGGRNTIFGFPNEGWKLWTTFDGTPVLVPECFNTDPEPNGDILLYPEGDKSAPPSGRMPYGGYYFDSIVRQPEIDEDNLRVEDNLEEFPYISDADLARFGSEAERLYTQTDKAILGNFGGTGFGDIALVPAPWLKYPKGIRDIEEWYVSTIIRKDLVNEIFSRQCEIALSNLQKIHAVVGNKISAIFMTGTDFGTQIGPFISRSAYQSLYMPYHKKLNDWVHENTTWKTFIHSCGSVVVLVDDFIDAGFDILNPVQCSATGMDAQTLKDRFGDRLVFWGGGVDTQRTLPFGTPQQVREEVRERIRIFGQDGGFIFNAIHNIQAKTPVENLIAMYDAVKEYGTYPL
ncbi:MAG: uroporphyrinogen decarboxylase family protein [Armatimonadota bacterium]